MTYDSYEGFDQEVWRQIPGFEWYEVSTIGRVRSLTHWTTKSDGVSMRFMGRMLKQIERNGYCYVGLSTIGKNGKRSTSWPTGVHRLVAWAFIGPQAKGIHVNHIDSNTRNNRVDNLEYVTPAGNLNHCRSSGRWRAPSNKGSKNPRAKLSDTSAMFIFANPEIPTSQIRRKFKLSTSAIYKIRNKKSWKHLHEI